MLKAHNSYYSAYPRCMKELYIRSVIIGVLLPLKLLRMLTGLMDTIRTFQYSTLDKFFSFRALLQSMIQLVLMVPWLALKGKADCRVIMDLESRPFQSFPRCNQPRGNSLIVCVRYKVSVKPERGKFIPLSMLRSTSSFFSGRSLRRFSNFRRASSSIDDFLTGWAGRAAVRS